MELKQKAVQDRHCMTSCNKKSKIMFWVQITHFTFLFPFYFKILNENLIMLTHNEEVKDTLNLSLNDSVTKSHFSLLYPQFSCLFWSCFECFSDKTFEASYRFMDNCVIICININLWNVKGYKMIISGTQQQKRTNDIIISIFLCFFISHDWHRKP